MVFESVMHYLGQARRYLTAAHGKEGQTKDKLEDSAKTAIAAAVRDSFDAPALGLDLDGTIDESPAFFAMLTKLWPGPVYVITYRTDHARAVADVQKFGVRFDEVILVNDFKMKSVVIAERNIKIYVDDMDEVLIHIPAGVTVLKIRNDGNSTDGKWLYSNQTGMGV